ncbi:MAG: hypothetical protein K9L30_11680 [Desulfobacterales bacterium]|nr:hypothetical protein [Desulfobacterales bacterium]
MNKDNHDKIRKKYGSLVVDFVTAQSSDDAIYCLFQNLSLIFEYNDFFLQNAWNAFPRIKKLESSLNKIEKKIIALLNKRREFLSSLSYLLCTSLMEIKRYDRKNKLFTVLKGRVDERCNFQYFKEDVLSESSIKQYLNDNELNILKVYIETEEKILDFEKTFDGFDKINTIYINNIDIYWGHSEIEDIRWRIKLLLNGIASGRNLNESKIINRILLYYRECHPKIIISKDGILDEIPPFSEEALQEKPQLKMNNEETFSNWHMHYMIPVIYCLVQFLLTNQYPFLRLCDDCDNLYIKKNATTQRFCSSKCRMHFNSQKAIKSGKAKEYKRKKRLEGAKESYYG